MLFFPPKIPISILPKLTDPQINLLSSPDLRGNVINHGFEMHVSVNCPVKFSNPAQCWRTAKEASALGMEMLVLQLST